MDSLLSANSIPGPAPSLLSTVYARRANVAAGGLEDLQQTLIPGWMDHCDPLKDSLGESKMKLGAGGRGGIVPWFFFLIMIIVCLKGALEIFLINIRAVIKLLVAIFISETGACEMLQELNCLWVGVDSANRDSWLVLKLQAWWVFYSKARSGKAGVLGTVTSVVSLLHPRENPGTNWLRKSRAEPGTVRSLPYSKPICQMRPTSAFCASVTNVVVAQVETRQRSRKQATFYLIKLTIQSVICPLLN